MTKLQKRLDDLAAKDRLRSLSLPHGIDLSSNDYLGMADHPKLRQVAIDALENGVALGSGGSRLLRGHAQEHHNLEEFAATYYGAEKALFFANGYGANYCFFTSVPTRKDVIIFDSLIHASARSGIQYSMSKHVRVQHNDLDAYRPALQKARADGAENIFVAIESVYSMDGDFAPLEELNALAQEFDAFLMIDEAHGSGIFGPSGKGLSQTLPASDHLIVMHTCGKAIGVAGGLVCASAAIIDLMINQARGFIYSTAPPPLQAYLVQKSLEILTDEPERRETLLALIEQTKTLLPEHYSGSQIIPIILGEDAKAIAAAKTLQEQGYDIRAIRPPTVPEGSARLRLSLNIGIAPETLKEFAKALSAVL